MNRISTKNSKSGKYVKEPGGGWAFVPNDLPPEMDYSAELVSLLALAERNLGELTGVAKEVYKNLGIIPFDYISLSYKKESVSSTRIEGTNISIEEVYQGEVHSLGSKSKAKELMEVKNYEKALLEGLSSSMDGKPISFRLIKKLHKILMQEVRDYHSAGEFRRNQVYIGSNRAEGATFIPPPVPEMLNCLDRWEEFVNEEQNISPVLKCALIHYQFEAIHPFWDGNGRLGRILINVFLNNFGYSSLYLPVSEFFEKNRTEYYERLNFVSKYGEWNKWIMFFLRAIAETSSNEERNLIELSTIYNEIQIKIQNAKNVPKKSVDVVQGLLKSPIIVISDVSRRMSIPYPLAKRIVNKLIELDILIELPPKARMMLPGSGKVKVFVNPALFRLMFGKQIISR